MYLLCDEVLLREGTDNLETEISASGCRRYVDDKTVANSQKWLIHIDGQQVGEVNKFNYLGSLLSDDGYCTKDIQSRIEMAN